jgi:hypothetical protein
MAIASVQNFLSPLQREFFVNAVHVKILLLFLLIPILSYIGWTLVFDHPAPPAKSWLVEEGHVSSSLPAVPSDRQTTSRQECDGLGVIALYSIILPSVAEHNQSHPGTASVMATPID